MAMVIRSASGGMTPPRDDSSSDEDGPAPAIIASSPEDSDDDESDDDEIAQRNNVLGPDGYFHPIKAIKGSYLKPDPATKKLRLVKRVRWMDSDVWADTVDAPHLPFRGYVNPKRKDVVDLTVPPKKRLGITIFYFNAH